MQLGKHNTPQWNSKPKFLKREHKKLFLTSNNYHASIPRWFYIEYFKVSWYNSTRSEQSNEYLGVGTKVVPVTTTRLPGRAAQGHHGGLMSCGTEELLLSSLTDLHLHLECAGFLWQATHLHFICSAARIWALLPEWAIHLQPGILTEHYKLLFSPAACCLTCPHAHRTRPYHALLNFPAIARLGSLLQYNPSTLLLVFKHKLWLKASQCLRLSCLYCKLQQLIRALTLRYHDLLDTGKMGEVRVFAMTPRLLRSLKLSQSSQRLLWLTPVTCGSSWVSWEER